jgi:hypothetical protein
VPEEPEGVHQSLEDGLHVLGCPALLPLVVRAQRLFHATESG